MNKLTRIKFLEQKIFQAHELMHQGKHEEAENILHDAMLCIKFNQQSAYLTHVVKKFEGDKVIVTFRSGGIGWISKILDTVGIGLLKDFQEKAPGNLKLINEERKEIKS